VNDFSHGDALLVRVDDPCMCSARCMESKEVSILGKEYATLTKRKSQQLLIAGSEHSGFCHCLYFHAASSKARNYRLSYMLISVKFDPLSHWASHPAAMIAFPLTRRLYACATPRRKPD